MAELTETLNQARTDILNLLAEFDAVVEWREGEGKYEPDSEDAAAVEDIRQRWIGGFGDTRPSGLTGYPDYEATDPPENDDVPLSAAEIDALQHPRCVSCGQPAHAWTPDGRGLCLRSDCRRHFGGHEPPAETLQGTVERKTADIEAAGLCEWKYSWRCPHCHEQNESSRVKVCGRCGGALNWPTPKCLGCEVRDGDLYALMRRFDSILGKEIEQRRAKQDAKHGGPEHDDTHTRSEWLIGIEDYVRMARYCEDGDAYEHFLIDVAALAVAAIQSSRRKRNA